MQTGHHWAWRTSQANRYVAVEDSRHDPYPLWLWWNILSLDAPTVSCLWAILFAHALHVRVAPIEIFALSATVWIIYASDRVLDGLRAGGQSALSDRHGFYARHAHPILWALLPATFGVACLAVTKLDVQTRNAGLEMAAALVFYFISIHILPGKQRAWFPKELIAGTFFAAGVTISIWSHARFIGVSHASPAIAFGALCALNCAAIECWEHHRGGREWDEEPSWLVRFADRRIGYIALICAMCTIGSSAYFPYAEKEWAPAAASAISFMLLTIIDRRSETLSPRVLRVFADVALLTPVLFLFRYPIF